MHVVAEPHQKCGKISAAPRVTWGEMPFPASVERSTHGVGRARKGRRGGREGVAEQVEDADFEGHGALEVDAGDDEKVDVGRVDDEDESTWARADDARMDVGARG